MDLLVHILILILIVGLVCWLIRLLGPTIGLPAPFVTAAIAIVCVIAIVWLLRLLLASDLALTLPR